MWEPSKNRYRWCYRKEGKIEKGSGTKQQLKEWEEEELNEKEPWKWAEKEIQGKPRKDGIKIKNRVFHDD